MEISKLLLVAFTCVTLASCANAKEEISAGAQVETTSMRECKVDIDIPKRNYVEYSVPDGDTSFKTYMSYRAITNTRSPQYKLQQNSWTDDDGLRRYQDYYEVALGTFYADNIGNRVRITLDSGESFEAVVADFKADCHTDKYNRYSPMHDGMKNVVEFIVDTSSLDSTAKRMGDISYIEGFEGNVTKIERIYENE